MMNWTRREIATRDLPDMPPLERDREWSKAKVCFDQALAQKQETDRIYKAAANRLNQIERVVKKELQLSASISRAAARSLITTARVAKSTLKDGLL